jgi:hypothetical protein
MDIEDEALSVCMVVKRFGVHPTNLPSTDQSVALRNIHWRQVAHFFTLRLPPRSCDSLLTPSGTAPEGTALSVNILIMDMFKGVLE